MGRHDSYSYYSESGQAGSGETPGEKDRTVRERKGDWCQECNERDPSTVERSGDLDGRKLCNDCTEELQYELDRKRSKKVLDLIDSDEE